MYDIALSVAAFVRSQTRADIAWLLSSPIVSNRNEAVVFTPGGGKLGSLLSGAFDGRLSEIAARKLDVGRIVECEVNPLEATLSGFDVGTKLRFAIAPATLFDADLWNSFLEREKIALDLKVSGNEITQLESYNSASILAADPELGEIFSTTSPTTFELAQRLISIFVPIRKIAIYGNGPVPQAIAGLAEAIGWQVAIETRPDNFAGVTATLSSMDSVVITGHEVESSSRALAYALESKAGYIGALGSQKMQNDRADWLAYRDIIEISRVNGPAGFPIGAKSPAEIAISVMAQALSVVNGI
jgi:xanthine dehydrogenase accessory factor